MLETPGEAILWAKYQFFERGIGPDEFRKARMGDIVDIMQIKNAVKEKQLREEMVKEMIANMR